MALTAETILGNLTPQIGQPISQTFIDVLKLATNAANAIYNLDLPTAAYLQGQAEVTTGYVLDTQPDLRFVGGMLQPYASDPGYILGPIQVDAANGFKGGVLHSLTAQ